MVEGQPRLKLLILIGCLLGLSTFDSSLAGLAPGSGDPSWAHTTMAERSAQLKPELLEPKTVEPIEADQFHQILAHYKGKVLLVNFWATWCIPCIREMPDLSKLQLKFKDRGFKVIGVSMDDAQDLESKVRPFFKKRSFSFISYLQAESDYEKFLSVIDDGWNGVLPTTYVIDRSGDVKKRLTGSKSFEEFATIIEPLLDSSP